MDIEGEWWDAGTASFVLEEGVYFMSGSINIADDNVTYALIFNKELYKKYAAKIANPYQTVRDWEWTLDYFNQIIQGISADNGDGTWNEKDTYGFITTWEYGNTFFLGSDLRYVINDENVDEPTLYLDTGSRMERALKVLELSSAIYHNNNATYMSPAGQENLGLAAFKENRGLFYSEVVSYLSTLTKEMETEFGVLPVPKYDKAQEFYRTWTHESGSTFSAVNSIKENKKDDVGLLMTALALMSHQHLKPAYYDIMLTSRNVTDVDSAEMLDLIFQNRVYDMGFYFELGFYNIFKTNVLENKNTFSSDYQSAKKSFNRTMGSLLDKLRRQNR